MSFLVLKFAVGALWHFKSVADFADCLDKGRAVWIGLDLVPQRSDAPVDTARGYQKIIAPHGSKDFIAGEREE